LASAAPMPCFGQKASASTASASRASGAGAAFRCKSGLQVPQCPKKRKIKTGRSLPCQAERPNQVWSYDFQKDGLLSGRKLRLLNVLDEFTCEWLSVTVGVSLTSQAALLALKPLFALRRAPCFVRSDNGPEFIAGEVQTCSKKAAPCRTTLTLAVRGRTGSCPWQNGFTEIFHGKLRDEFLNREVFASVAEAQVRLEVQRRWYNEERPHSSLKYVSPAAFARAWRQQEQQKQVEDKPPR